MILRRTAGHGPKAGARLSSSSARGGHSGKPSDNLKVQNGHRTTYTEATKIQGRRIAKAERDERMDITLALTPVRTYMSGFTRPTSLRTSNWFPGGRYSVLGKAYESPSPAAYEPHTVFLLESRYPIRWGVGRVDSLDHIVGVCRAGDFPAVLEKYNSARAGKEILEVMDNARWPWAAQKRANPVKWWSSKEELKEALKDRALSDSMLEMHTDETAASKPFSKVKRVNKDEWAAASEEEADFKKELEKDSQQTVKFDHSELLPRRTFDDENPIHFTSEKHMSRQKAAVAESVSDYTPMFSTEMRRHSGKIPFEVEHKDGVYAHPSGYVPPTPAHHFSSGGGEAPLPPSQSGTPTRSSRIDETYHGQLHHESWQAIKEAENEKELMPGLKEGILSGSLHASTAPRDEKIPTEVIGATDQHGEVLPPQHPSGFVPPTPAMDRGESPAWTADISPSELKRRAARGEEYPQDLESASENHGTQSFSTIRSQYLPHIEKEPFYRPLITFTLSTRPLALTLSRLSKGLAKGLPYHATLTSEDRKARLSYSNRMRCLRLNRLQELSVALAQSLAGQRGGLVGIRFDTDDAGRGVDGSGLDAPIPHDKRAIKIGVASWYNEIDDYPRAEELKETYRVLGNDEVGTLYDAELGHEVGPFELYDLDERGRRYDPETGKEVPWPSHAESEGESNVKDAFLERRRLLSVLNDAEKTPELCLIVPKSGLDDLNYADAHGNIIRIVDKETPVQGETVKLLGGQARNFLKARLEQLHMLYRSEFAHRFAERNPSVVYPDKKPIRR